MTAAVAVSWGMVKGTILAAVLAALSITFVDQLVVAVVSGGLGCVGVVLGAYVASREARKTREVVHQVRDEVTENREAIQQARYPGT